MKKYIVSMIVLYLFTHAMMPAYQCPEDKNSLEYLATCAMGIRQLDWELQQLSPDKKQNIVNALLFRAIEAANIPAIHALVQHGANLNLATELGTPLTYAMTQAKNTPSGVEKMDPIIRTLLTAGASPLEKDLSNKSPLDYVMLYTAYKNNESVDYINLFQEYARVQQNTVKSLTPEEELAEFAGAIHDSSNDAIMRLVAEWLYEQKESIFKQDTETKMIIMQKLQDKIDWGTQEMIETTLARFDRHQLIELLYFLFVLQKEEPDIEVIGVNKK